MKKLTAIILTCVLGLSLSITCFASDGGKITGIAAKVNSFAASLEDKLADKLIIAGGQDLDAVVAPAFAGLRAKTAKAAAPKAFVPAAAPSRQQSLKSAAADIAKYIFIPVSDPSEAADIIAQSCEFTYTVVSDGKGTVYIKVNVEENPQIFSFPVFHELVDKLYAGEKEEMAKNSDGSTDYLMSYEHIAAELALHMLVYAATNQIIELAGSGNDTILNLYNSAKEAELNYDESRLPANWMNALGRLIITMFRYDIFCIFNLG